MMNLLWSKIRENDEESFKSLFYHLYPELVRHAQTYLFDKDKSKDVVQEVFIDLWENAHKIEINTSLNAYLYAMVRNKCLNYLRSIKITEGIEAMESLTESDTYFKLDQKENNKKYKKVLFIVDSFPDRMGEVFKMRYLDNYTYNEIASQLDISLNTVKTQLRRARKRLSLQINK